MFKEDCASSAPIAWERSGSEGGKGERSGSEGERGGRGGRVRGRGVGG